jgi:hypothetical protein
VNKEIVFKVEVNYDNKICRLQSSFSFIFCSGKLFVVVAFPYYFERESMGEEN